MRRSLLRARASRLKLRLLSYLAFGVAVTLGGLIWTCWHILEPLCERLAAYSIYPEG